MLHVDLDIEKIESNSVISRMWARTCLIVIASTVGCVAQTQYFNEQRETA